MARFSRLLPVALIAVAIAACGSNPPYRDEKFDDRELNAALAFLREPGASRSVVEARLGSPQATFEQGRIVAYHLDRVEKPGPPANSPGAKPLVEMEWRAQPSMPRRAWERQLMIEYDTEGHVVRHTVL